MDSAHINQITIEKFKCFDNFKLDGLEHVNLLGGKNNIGKTAFLEACYVHASTSDRSSMANALIDIKFMRENINILFDSNLRNNYESSFLESNKIYSFKSNQKNTFFQLLVEDGKKEYIFRIQEEEKTINANDFSIERAWAANIDFIDNFGWSNQEIAHAYEIVQRKEKEQILNQFINKFEPSIASFKVFSGIPHCKRGNDYYPLTEFGDGTKHYVSIICALYASENGTLFIDEIDNGIHYTELKNLWKIIIDISKQINCQVFATTHSRECIEAFNEAQRELNEPKTAYFEFYRNAKTKEISAKKRDAEQLEYALTHQGSFRGE